ncbi:hypothetical protein ACP4OV_030161 [Aristida adscensionis]
MAARRRAGVEVESTAAAVGWRARRGAQINSDGGGLVVPHALEGLELAATLDGALCVEKPHAGEDLANEL